VAFGQTDGGLDRPFALGAFAFLVGLRIGLKSDRGDCGQVPHPTQSTTIALRVLQSPGPVSLSPSHRSQSGSCGQLVDRPDQCNIHNCGQEFGTEPENHARHVVNHFGEPIAVKLVLDASVLLFNADNGFRELATRQKDDFGMPLCQLGGSRQRRRYRDQLLVQPIQGVGAVSD